MTRIEKIILAALISSASVMASFISPELALIKQFFSLSKNQLSYVMTFYLAGYLSGQVVWAYASNRIGRLLSIKLGMATSILGAIVIIVAMKTESFNLFLLGRVLIALGLASGLVCGFTMIKEKLSDHESKPYLSIIAVVFTASIYFAILLSGYLVKFTSLDFVMYFVFLYNTAMFLLCFYMNNNPLQPQFAGKLKSLVNIELQPKVIVFSLVLSITTIISYSYALYAPIITNELFSMSPTEFGICSLSNMIFILLGGVLYLKLAKKLPEHVIISFGLLIIIAACSASLLAAKLNIQMTTFGFFILCSLLNLANGVIYPAATFKALEFGICKATSSAIMNLIKLTMPIIALYSSAHFAVKELTAFALTILLFAVSYLFILQLTKIRLPRLFRDKLAQ
ncbi:MULTISPECIES: MFS transporter [unclassified Legionella]|uniref:MFS transporter n=1 Tax=unclassified Legionella TaxID=2622702 RepID=UPI00105421EE|nr:MULTISPECIES: MFS transporter [unclassified Legionella]MDI9818629.1 MFS transporter [Legionella sp. PL877]